MEVFSDAWAQACCRALNDSPAYRASAAEWQGSIVLALAGDGAADRLVFIDAQRGECRAAHLVDEAGAAAASFVFRANASTWRRLLDGQLDPVAAVMQGSLRLTRGSLFVLARYAQAARDMVAAAARVGGTFPSPEDA